MQPVRCAVVGVGMMGSVHASVLARLTEADLVACCDVDPAAAARMPPGVNRHEELDEVLALPGLEAVFVCTPQESHLPVVERSLEAGVAVFCEKPIAHDLHDADRMIAAAEQREGRLMVGHTMRFEPDYIALVDAVSAGAIGAPVHLAARRNVPAFEGRLLAHRTTLAVEVGVHDLDLLRWLAGDVVRVFATAATTKSLGEGAVDAIMATLRFASGAVAIVELNWIMSGALTGDYRLAVFGTDGAGYVEMRDPVTRVFGRGGAGWLRTRHFDVGGTMAGTVATEDRHFLATVRGLRPWPVSLEDARAALEVAVAIDRSIEEGVPVAVGM